MTPYVKMMHRKKRRGRILLKNHKLEGFKKRKLVDLFIISIFILFGRWRGVERVISLGGDCQFLVDMQTGLILHNA